jgi:uridine phosphorylase
LFIAGPAIGAPAATLVMEKLIALGAQRIILMGWCGAVDRGYSIGDIVIPGNAVSGEGTSQYYCDGGQRPPSLQTAEFLQEMMSTQKLDWKGGTIWSTDAPYRESRKYLAELYGRQKVIGVDMEFAALCNVAGFRGIDFAAILLVSDEIMGEAWRPGFKKTVFTERSRLLIRLLLQAHHQGIS